MKIEHRQVQVAVTPNDDGPTVDGLPTQFWARVLNYGLLDDYGTKFRPGAFTASLQRRLPRLMYGHAGWNNPDALLGKGIDFRDSQEGLDILFEFDDFAYVPRAKQIAYQIKSTTLDQFSIGFVRQKDSRDAGDSATWIDLGRLGEVSTVVEGSVPNTKVLSMRAAAAGGTTVPVDDVIKILAAMQLGQLNLKDALAQLDELGQDPSTPPAGDPPEPPPAPTAGDPTPPPASDPEPPAVGDGTPPPPADELPPPPPDPYEDPEAEAIMDAALEVLIGRDIQDALDVRGDKAGHKFHGNQWTGSPKPTMKKKKRKPQPAQARMASQRTLGSRVETRAAIGQGADGGTTMDVTLVHPEFAYVARYHEDSSLDHGHLTHMNADRGAQMAVESRIAAFHDALERSPHMTNNVHPKAGPVGGYVTDKHRSIAKDLARQLH